MHDERPKRGSGMVFREEETLYAENTGCNRVISRERVVNERVTGSIKRFCVICERCRKCEDGLG